MTRLKILLISSLFAFQFCAQKSEEKRFGFISTDKEWEIELIIKNDNTFMYSDKFGCNQLLQKGKWKLIEKDEGKMVLLLEDENIKIEHSKDRSGRNIIVYKSNVDGLNYSNRQDSQFPLIKKDTVIINDKSLLLHGKFFKETNENLQTKRVLQIEKEFITKYGERDYIDSFGEGKSKELARKNLIKCGTQ